ncbi:MAG: hypothetical protein K5770_20895 [Lachnospiraceae bacterium]|nr:hypothetical protein [Lachnospiraceae bacterium]
MKNMMKEYLGREYSRNHLRNFCLYWINAYESRRCYATSDEWRKKNDLDCMYYDGDLRADTLMSAWTPIKWIADYLNRDSGITFCKNSRISKNPCHDLELLAENGDCYLPEENELVKLLDRFLELAELKCNYILLPSEEMNCARYRCAIVNELVWLYDEVPATLAHIFDKNSLGRFFVDNDQAIKWIKREHLEMGFEDNKIDPYHVRPLINGLVPYTPKWLTEEDEIKEALEYMIDFLETRMKAISVVEEKESDKEGCPDSLLPWWKRLDEVEFEAFDNIYQDLPDGLILFRDKPYILLSVKKRIEYSARNIIDDIEFDVYESGIRMEFEVVRCGSDKRTPRWTIYWKPGQTCREVFSEHHIEIPDEKRRKMYEPLLKRSRMLMDDQKKECDDTQKADGEEKIYPFS